MPAVEVGFAVTEMVLVTVAPFVGEVMETETPVLLIVRVTGIVCGELEAAGSLIVAVAFQVPRARVAGFMMKETVVLAPPVIELEDLLNISQGCVLDADQLRVVKAVPLFVMTMDCDEVAVLPCAAEKVRVEVGTERTAWFATVTVMGEELAVLL